MVPLSYVHFPLLKLHCHKLKEKIIVKLVKIETYIDFNDSYIFFDSYIYFFSYHRDDITVSLKPPTLNSRHFLLLFPSQKLMHNNCP